MKADPARSQEVRDSNSGDRGRLEISPRAVERIAEATALKARGVFRQQATFGRGLPAAKAQLAGQRVRLDVEIAVEWGYPLADLAAEIRGRITGTVAELTGLAVDAVSVDISAVELPESVNRAGKNPRRVV
ncbi:Asp23/Gls24 family envelope stress response protein [Kribbella sp. NPDC051718]|uniref:Asp23/Gls24 family envelope stress response protein n=1 Tax=Kribbella sp. NPDC051718 TaxID=3155168 RepID=UPI0034384D41